MALLFPLFTGQDWANKRVSGSDGGDGQWRPPRDALLSALIVHDDNLLWQELLGGSWGLFAAQSKVHTLKQMILVAVAKEEEVKGQGDHNHPLVLDGGHAEWMESLDSI